LVSEEVLQLVNSARTVMVGRINRVCFIVFLRRVGVR